MEGTATTAMFWEDFRPGRPLYSKEPLPPRIRIPPHFPGHNAQCINRLVSHGNFDPPDPVARDVILTPAQWREISVVEEISPLPCRG
jgi:hypothetical protein